jgi:hypothetical protein
MFETRAEGKKKGIGGNKLRGGILWSRIADFWDRGIGRAWN